MPRLHIVVSDDQKTEWEEYADETDEYDNLSDLVRTSVTKEISRDKDTESEWTEKQVEAIFEYLEEINSTSQTTLSVLEEFRGETADKADIKETIDYQRASIEQIVEEAVEEGLQEVLESDE